VEVKFN